MNSWNIVLWESKNGRKPVERWLKNLSTTHKRKIDKLFGLLEGFDPELKLPHNKNIGDGLFELRDTSRGPGYRIYYSINNSFIVVLLAAGSKSTQEKDILIAKRRLQDEEE